MLGIVLCGGQSTRMGSDKGLLQYGSKTWAQIAIDKLNGFEFPIVVSIHKDQFNGYSNIFSSQLLIEDDALLKGRGPLIALLSIHLKNPAEDLLIIACDLLLMEAELLKELLEYYNKHKDFDAFVFSNGGEAEPLCGIYKASGLRKILHLYQNGQLLKHSMKYCLEQINTYSIPLSDDKKKCFQNFNSLSDLTDL